MDRVFQFYNGQSEFFRLSFLGLVFRNSYRGFSFRVFVKMMMVLCIRVLQIEFSYIRYGFPIGVFEIQLYAPWSSNRGFSDLDPCNSDFQSGFFRSRSMALGFPIGVFHF